MSFRECYLPEAKATSSEEPLEAVSGKGGFSTDRGKARRE